MPLAFDASKNRRSRVVDVLIARLRGGDKREPMSGFGGKADIVVTSRNFRL
jgi:hypothetical protein